MTLNLLLQFPATLQIIVAATLLFLLVWCSIGRLMPSTSTSATLHELSTTNTSTESLLHTVPIDHVNTFGRLPLDTSKKTDPTLVLATAPVDYSRQISSETTITASQATLERGKTGTPGIVCGTARTAVLTPALAAREAVSPTSPRLCQARRAMPSLSRFATTRLCPMKTSGWRGWNFLFAEEWYPFPALNGLCSSLRHFKSFFHIFFTILSEPSPWIGICSTSYTFLVSLLPFLLLQNPGSNAFPLFLLQEIPPPSTSLSFLQQDLLFCVRFEAHCIPCINQHWESAYIVQVNRMVPCWADLYRLRNGTGAHWEKKASLWRCPQTKSVKLQRRVKDQ